ncbi:PH domain-containing protein [Nonomuraea insulae]|uniref:PH domain-containing protein n=1 Tax=Nonomuraea insulae TaxID=1616787 RepID=A0ABW1CNR2_9ACTN
MRTETAWRRLSPRMLIVHPFQEVIRTAPLLLGVLIAGTTSGGEGHLWGLAAAGVMVVLGMSRWFTTTYMITSEQVQVRRGLLRKRVVTVPMDRIRSVDITSNVLHRVLGLARVEIGTGRSDRKGGGELKLDALQTAAATRLREELLHRTPATVGANAPGAPAVPGIGPAASPPEQEVAALRPSWIGYGPFTLSGVLTVGILGGFVGRVVNEGNVDLRSISSVRATWDWLNGLSLPAEIATITAVLIVFVAVASTLGYVLAFWNFRLTRPTAGTLHVTRGLITTRATTLEERRLRGVELSEPLLLRAVRGARLIAVTTGLRVGRGAQRGGSMLLPPAPRAENERVAAAVLGGSAALTEPLTAHGPIARRRRFTRAVGLNAVVAALLLMLWLLPTDLYEWTWITALALLPFTALLAADRYRNLGHALTGPYLVTRWGSLVRRRVALERDGIVGWTVERSFFQRRAGVVTLTATTAAGRQSYRVQDIELGPALDLARAGVPGLIEPFLVTSGSAPARQPA